MTPRVWVEQIEFNDGSRLDFGKSDIVVIVGPNNSGKSATLRSIRDLLTSGGTSPIVSKLTRKQEGSIEDVITRLSSFTKISEPLSDNPRYVAFGATVHTSQLTP